MRSKIFEYAGGVPAMDEIMNRWLAQHPGIHIRHLAQSSCWKPVEGNGQAMTTLTIFYEEDREVESPLSR